MTLKRFKSNAAHRQLLTRLVGHSFREDAWSFTGVSCKKVQKLLELFCWIIRVAAHPKRLLAARTTASITQKAETRLREKRFQAIV
jgi:hypothetical protein